MSRLPAIATALAGWRWLPGMLAREHGSTGVVRVKAAPFLAGIGPGSVQFRLAEGHGWYPVLGDPATEGCLLRLLGPVQATYCARWVVRLPDDRREHEAAVLGEALVEAAKWLGQWPGGFGSEPIESQSVSQ